MWCMVGVWEGVEACALLSAWQSSWRALCLRLGSPGQQLNTALRNVCQQQMAHIATEHIVQCATSCIHHQAADVLFQNKHPVTTVESDRPSEPQAVVLHVPDTNK